MTIMNQIFKQHVLNVGAAAVFAALALEITCGIVWSQSGESETAKVPLGTTNAESMEVVGYDQVRTVLRRRCVTCHNPEELRGDLNLSSMEGIATGSGSGPVVVAGQPNQSMLYTTAAHLEDPRMPPNRPRIPGSELELIRRWIIGGLAEKSGTAPAAPAVDPDAAAALARNNPEPKAMSVTASAATPTTATRSAPADSVNLDLPKVMPTVEREFGLKPILPLAQPTAITVLATHPTRPLVAVAGRGQACLYDIETGQWLGAWEGPEPAAAGGDVTALRFSRDGQLLLVAGGVPGLSGKVIAYELKGGRRKFELADENDSILTMDLSADGRYLALGGPTKAVRVFEVAQGNVKHLFRKHTDWILHLAFSPDGLLLATADRFGGLFVWDVESGELFQTFRGHQQAIHELSWEPTGDILWSAGEDGRLRSWDLHQGALRSTWEHAGGSILSMVQLPTGLAAGSRSGQLQLWSHDGQSTDVWKLGAPVESVGLIGDGSRLVVGDARGQLHLIKSGVTQAERVFQLPVEARSRESLLTELAKLESELAARMRDLAAAAQQPAKTDAISMQSAEKATAETSAPYLQVQLAQQQVLSLQTNLESTSQALSRLESTVTEAQKALLLLETTRAELAALLADQTRQLEQAEELVAALAKQTNTTGNTEVSGDPRTRQRLQLEQKLERQRALLAETLKARAAIFPADESQAEQTAVASSRQLLDQFLRDIQTQINESEQALRELRGSSK